MKWMLGAGLTLAAVLAATSCSSSKSKGDACIPGASLPCAGSNACVGEQVCNADGTALGACVCSSSSRADAGSSGSARGSSSGSRGMGSSSSGSETGSSSVSGSGTGASSGTSSGSSMGFGPDGGPCSFASNDTVDHDGDGWSNADGDCDDCNKFVNPGAYDIPGNHIDEDCNGVPDDEPTGCDTSLTSLGVATSSGSEGAKAMDLCRTTTATPPLPMKTWGVLSADYVLPDGTGGTADGGMPSANFALGFGLLGPSFGTNNLVQHGVRMLGLSSGTARQPTDPGYQDVAGFDKGYTSGAPAGFPKQVPACPGVVFGQPHDGAALRVVLRIPTNALTMTFDANFFSYEFPDYVCSAYNDTFVAIITPSPTGEPSDADDNVSYDSMGNPISVNSSSFLTVCDPHALDAGVPGYACSEGPTKLLATGFGIDTTSTSDAGDDINHASTDWLRTSVSVSALAGQEVILLFAIWDSTDGILDSTVLLDNIGWSFATSPTQAPATAAPATAAASH